MTASPLCLKDLLIVLEEIARPSLAESWDNVGLMLGDPGQEINAVWRVSQLNHLIGI